MRGSRKYIQSLISSIEAIKSRYEYIKKDVISLTQPKDYEAVIGHYDQLLEMLNQELISLPIGFRYTGTFYMKNSYPIPGKFEKYEGTLYMKEDLVSWQVEEGLGRPDYGYHRNIFKEPKLGTELTRDDAIPVYATKK